VDYGGESVTSTAPATPQRKADDGTQESEALDNARVGYGVATSLWTYDGNLIWTRFDAMLVANSIVIATTGVLLSVGGSKDWIAFAFPFAGLAICVLWWAMMVRGFDYYKYWIYSAKELEERYLSGQIKTVSRGGVFADGKKVYFHLNEGETAHEMRPWGRIKVEHLAKFVVLVFASIYVTILVWLFAASGGSIGSDHKDVWDAVVMGVGVLALVIGVISIVIVVKFHASERSARDKHEKTEEKRFIANASTLQEIKDAISRSGLARKGDQERIDASWAEFVSVAQSTGSDWRPEMAKVYTQKMRPLTLAEDQKAASDGSPPESDSEK
jgi:hypothetical protein